MSFSDYADRLDEAVMAHLADTQSATYTPASGDPVTIPVMVDRDVERTQPGQQSTTVERRTELTAYLDDLKDARRSETVTVAGETWRLDKKDRDDGSFVTWFVTKAPPA